MVEETSVLRWGGLAGILAVSFFIVNFPVFAFFSPPPTPEGFPDIRAGLAASTILSMATDFLAVGLVLALYQALREIGPGPALFGGVLAVLGFVVIALGDASTFVAFVPLSDLYHAPGATLEDQATLVLLWEATHGIALTFFFVGNLSLMIGFIALGLAMREASSFGSRFGGVSLGLGVAGGIGVLVSLFLLAAFAVAALAIPIFLALFGWKVYSLSRGVQPAASE